MTLGPSRPSPAEPEPPGPELAGAPGADGAHRWRALRVFAENRLALVSAIFLIAVAAFCYLGPLLHHTDQIHTNLGTVNAPPGTQGHLLGTDDQGYDELGRLMIGGQTSLEVGVGAALLATAAGAVIGAFSGFFGGWLDGIVMRCVDGLLAIPTVFLLLLLAAIVTPTKLSLIVIIALISWLVTARLVRGEALTLRTRDFVSAARVMGSSTPRTVLRHIVPNSLSVIVVNATFQVADAILVLATLSFLGLGLPAPQTDLGGMLNNGMTYVYNGTWWVIWPAGVLIIAIVVAFNFIGDGLRDAFEVRLQRR
ncbi:ABC transporter permease [Flexivirga caeni]|uniref:ABC transporter permease n=1 Tax=Flexivirga caeni TaxID=2294115 RepID=A0A3M9M7Y1_9MICO|nr:ABC transporter permease [Flexivirga caeni]RNI21317.1 ABC transporter permease [Flexivirga caeni]